MKNTVKYFVTLPVFLCMVANVIYAQDTAKVVLSLDTCIKIALTQSAEILYKEDSVKITGAELMGAYGQFLPNLTFGGNYYYDAGNDLYTFTEPTLVNTRQTAGNYQLTTSVNIFNGFANHSALQAAILSKSASQYDLQRAQQQITFDITQSFLQIILDRRILKEAEENFDVSTTREGQLQELTDVGRRDITDLYEQQAQTSSNKLYMIQAEEKLKNDEILILRKMKISQTDKYVIGMMAVDTLPLGPDYNNVQNLVDKAMQLRPDLQASALSIKIAGWQIEENKSGYLPRLNLYGGMYSEGGYFYSLNVNGMDELGPQYPYFQALFGFVYGEVGLNLSWNIFDKFATKSRVEIAKIIMENNKFQNEDLMVQISSDIKQAYNDYVSALQQLETAEKGLVAADRAYRAVEEEYNAGRADFVTLSNSQAELLQAKVSKSQADVNLALQKKIIDYYVGK